MILAKRLQSWLPTCLVHRFAVTCALPCPAHHHHHHHASWHVITHTDTKWGRLTCWHKSDPLVQLPASLQRLVVYEARSYNGLGDCMLGSLAHLTSLTEIDFGYFTTKMPKDKPDAPLRLSTSLQRICCASGDRMGGRYDMDVLLPLKSLCHLEGSYATDFLSQLAAGVSSLTHVELEFHLGGPHLVPDDHVDGTDGLSQAVASLEAAGVAGAVRKVTLKHYVEDSVRELTRCKVLQLARLPSLCALAISNSCDREGLAALGRLTGLTRLDLSSWRVNSKEDLWQLPGVLSELPLLRELVMRDDCFLLFLLFLFILL